MPLVIPFCSLVSCAKKIRKDVGFLKNLKFLTRVSLHTHTHTPEEGGEMEKKVMQKEETFELDFLTHYLKGNLDSLHSMFVSLDTNRMSIVRIGRPYYTYSFPHNTPYRYFYHLKSRFDWTT